MPSNTNSNSIISIPTVVGEAPDGPGGSVVVNFNSASFYGVVTGWDTQYPYGSWIDGLVNGLQPYEANTAIAGGTIVFGMGSDVGEDFIYSITDSAGTVFLVSDPTCTYNLTSGRSTWFWVDAAVAAFPGTGTSSTTVQW